MTFWRRPREWFSAHPFFADALLAAAVSAFEVFAVLNSPTIAEGIEYRKPTVLALLVLLTSTVPIAWRRTAPMAVLVVTVVTAIAYEAMGFVSAPAALGALIALYTVVAHSDRRRSFYGAGIAAVGIVVVLLTARWGSDPNGIALNLIVFLTAWLVGDNVRTRRQRLAALEERAERAEQTRTAEAQRAVAEERTHIARELHDVVAHSLSVIIVQAGAARRVIEKEPVRAVGALVAIETTGREAMNEMRRLLTVLRTDGESPGPRPQPTLTGLADLVDECRSAGLATEVTVTGNERELPPGVALTAYRIVQEALTNSLKHAGPGAAAIVRVHYDACEVDVEVTDDGRGASSQNLGTGHGLIGMQERVDMCGGALTSGASPGGGFQVRAVLPLDAIVS